MDAPPPQSDVLKRLTPLGARGGYAAIFVALAASFVVLAWPLVYWRNADMDFMILHSVLLINDGKPQTYFDHPAQLLIALTADWFRLLHALGLLQYWAMSTLPPASDPSAFDAALTQAVRAE